MKKLYVLFLFALPLFSLAQDTIRQSDEPIANLYFASAIDPNYSAAILPGGAAQTWDYTNLQLVDTGGGHFVSAAGTPFEATFSPANLAVHDSDSTKNNWAYFLTSSSGFYTKGVDSSGLSVVLTPPWLYVPVPFTYNDTYFSTARAEVDTSYDTLSITVPIKIVQTINSYFDADGWGTLELPSGIFNNTLRVKVREVTFDTIYYNIGLGWQVLGTPTSSQSHAYRWVRHNGPDVYLLEIRADSAGTTATRSEYEIGSLISVPEIAGANQHLKSFPSPTRDIINIDFGVESGVTGTINIYNSIGAIVRSAEFRNMNQYVMYINTFDNGLYYFVVNSSDNKIRTGSFVVSH